MYDREFDGKTLEFETSGGLLDASLVMRDRETDSWWSIMEGGAIGGRMQGQRLEQLPAAEKITWGEWRARHPETLVLSVNGQEYTADDPFAPYFASDETFKGLEVCDTRLDPKQMIFAFERAGARYAVPHTAFADGALLELPGAPELRLLLYRRRDAAALASTRALIVPRELVRSSRGRLESRPRADAAWAVLRLRSGMQDFEAMARLDGAEPLEGFDTFWYNYVAVHPEVQILR